MLELIDYIKYYRSINGWRQSIYRYFDQFTDNDEFEKYRTAHNDQNDLYECVWLQSTGMLRWIRLGYIRYVFHANAIYIISNQKDQIRYSFYPDQSLRFIQYPDNGIRFHILFVRFYRNGYIILRRDDYECRDEKLYFSEKLQFTEKNEDLITRHPIIKLVDLNLCREYLFQPIQTEQAQHKVQPIQTESPREIQSPTIIKSLTADEVASFHHATIYQILYGDGVPMC